MATVIDHTADSTPEPAKDTPEPTLVGYVAQFDDVPSLMHAAEKTRDAGFKSFDCYTPFPVHGIDDAMGTKPTKLPFIVLGCAFLGATTAMGLQFFTNAFDYKHIVSGKPFFSIPSNMPVTFELAVLFSAFGALLGMLALNNLPRLYNRLFFIDPFLKVTTNGFFLGIESDDPKFDETETKSFLERMKPSRIEQCLEHHESVALPQFLGPLAVVALILGLVPLVIVARMRVMPSNVPRIEILHDMDSQPKVKTQTVSEMFPDDRAMRPILAGTIARGDYYDDIAFSEGLIPDQADSVDRSQLLPNAKNPDGTTVNLLEFPWITEFPVEVNQELMARGQERYNIYCATCHGMTGKGDGLVTQRAMALQKGSPGIGTWIKPITLYDEPIRKQAIGQLFNSITHGVRKMPAYGSQIPIDDRWAIILYVRALQYAGSQSIDELPKDIRQQLQADAD